MTTASATRPVPLCVDCDGTLIRTDLLHESLLLLMKQAPSAIFLLPFWLMRGKAYLKQRVAERVTFRWDTLPFCERALEIVRAAKAERRPVVLATASPQVWADAIALQAGGFDTVLATTEELNLGGEAKAQRLVALFGERGFDYIGNSSSDLPVWSRARHGLVVSSSHGLIDQARARTEVTESIPGARGGWLAHLMMIRAHQWLKNLLVFVPLVAAHRLSDGGGLAQAVIAFVAFSLCASSVYLLNDLLDLESDRQHVRKRNRALAAGNIPIHRALLGAPLLLAAALGLASLLPHTFLLVLAAYFVMTVAYSFRLKRQVIVDLILLAALYTMRVIAGAAATGVVPSFWLLAFSIFLFFSLAIVKRYSEMQIIFAQNKQQAAGRGYLVSDLPVLLSLGVASGMAAAMVIALYINDPETRHLYANTMWLWVVPPLVLYWVARVWMKAHRMEIDDDPVVFAARDWQSLLTVVLVGGCFVAASM
jgi:4-hydroxybenzoate polyprenyltransferase/phosphoserine phosphatase